MTHPKFFPILDLLDQLDHRQHPEPNQPPQLKLSQIEQGLRLLTESLAVSSMLEQGIYTEMLYNAASILSQLDTAHAQYYEACSAKYNCVPITNKVTQ